MPEPATLCFYVTGHGFGHAMRTIQTLKALPLDLRLLVKTTAPASLFAEELPGRSVTVIPAEYDCGCVQRDSITILPRETLDRYREVARRNDTLLSAEVAFLRRENVRCVLSDIPSFPLRAAQEAGVPSIAVANFTWADIYQEYIENEDDARLVQAMKTEYGAATLALITPLSLPTVADPFPRTEQIPLIARRGRKMRPELVKWSGKQNGTHFALFYLGVWGFQLDWPALGRLSDWTFLTYEVPSVALPNVISISRRDWAYADVAASVDAVISKPGYGTVTECIANSVPFLYVPRAGFAESQALVDGMARWGGGVPISEADFAAGNWQDALKAALAARPDAAAYAVNGAEAVAEKLRNFYT